MSHLTRVQRGCLIAMGCLVTLSLTGCTMHLMGVLNPKGIIAYEERKLLFDSLALMLIVVLPVIIMSLTFIYHYQISHRTTDYQPDWSHSYFLESLWWGIPCAIIFVLAILTWKKTYELDPYRNITLTHHKPLTIEVIALPWKWLFIYPEQHIATINDLTIPAGRQIIFSMTTDNVPMSAFFIPQLGSQIYLMAGMSTQLHLLADAVGTYDGMNTQFNGTGFAEMRFTVHVVDNQAMQSWINHVKQSAPHLTEETYQQLLTPAVNAPIFFFSTIPKNLFNTVLSIYRKTYGVKHPRQAA